ncbi:MAG: GEVED domain-containing protein [Chitinophagaceae bacterium]
MKKALLIPAFFCLAALNAQEVQVQQADCPAPILVQDSIVWPYRALITWENYNGSMPESYNLLYKETNRRGKPDTVFNITDSFYEMKNLKPSTNYSVRVASVCKNGEVSKYVPNYSWKFYTNAKGNYCWSVGNGLDYIEAIRLGGITYRSGEDDGYGDYTSTIIPLTANNTFKLYLQAHLFFPNNIFQFRVYIDYNQNRNFEPNEFVGTVPVTSEDGVNINFKVPADAKNGDTRLRIVFDETFLSYNSPCGNATNGETEDYTVRINGGTFQGFGALKNIPAEDAANNLQIAPNPVSAGNATIQYDLIFNGNVQIIIRDYLGKNVQLFDKGNLNKGRYSEKINIQNFTSGIYQVELLQNGQVIGRQKLVVIR